MLQPERAFVSLEISMKMESQNVRNQKPVSLTLGEENKKAAAICES